MKQQLSSFVLLLGAIASNTAYSAEVFVPFGDTWRYDDDGIEDANWSAITFNDGNWNRASAELGFGDDQATVINNNGSTTLPNKLQYYFRKTISIPNVSAWPTYTLLVESDDTADVYVNGTLVQANIPGGDNIRTAVDLPLNLLVNGDNVIAVEVRNSRSGSSDVSFDLELKGVDGVDGIDGTGVTRGPYLQNATDTTMTIRWRTDKPVTGRVSYGNAANNLTNTINADVAGTEHEITITGLTAGTEYYYSIGDTTGRVVAGGDANHYFRTNPTPGVEAPTRVWVIGDAGTSDSNQANVYNAYRNLTGTTHTDVWLQLGDNAYGSGTDAQYQTALFEMYPEMLRNTCTWPTLGNHDDVSANSDAQSGVYYDIFTMPKAGEAGGVPSGTEAYYSFDYGRTHFVCLDTSDTKRSAGSAMHNWLEQDLIAAQGKYDWIIVFFHHPPYSYGSHDYRVERLGSAAGDMRGLYVPLFDAYGVDLVLSGHSHSYERSVLMKDLSYTGPLNIDTEVYQANPSAYAVDSGDGNPNGDGAYAYENFQGNNVDHGTVYCVAGSSGKRRGVNTMAFMEASLNVLGSVVLEINGDTLDATFLDDTGAVRDYYRIVHGNVAEKPAEKPEQDLIPNNAVWAYDDDGVEDVNWKENTFDDSGWATGPTQIGYGDGDEATLVTGNLIAYYFRHTFEIEDPASISNIIGELIYDDGAIIYVNGTEVDRVNMPAGPVNQTTVASSTAQNNSVHTFSFDSSLFVAGANTIAVEVHNRSTSSSDITFKLGLTADISDTSSPASEIFIPYNSTWSYDEDGSADTNWQSSSFNSGNWTSGPAHLGFGDGDEATTLTSGHLTYYFRHTFNVTTAADVVTLGAELIYDDGAVIYVNGVEVHRENMPAGSIDETTRANSTSPDNSTVAFAIDPAVLVDGENIVAVEIHNRSTSSSDISFDLQMNGTTTRSKPVAPAVPVVSTEQLVSFNTDWMYDDDGSEDADWQNIGFLANGWSAGASQLGFGDGDETTTLASGHLAYYFRESFEIEKASTVISVSAELIYDDGAVIYVNGVEVHRENMPAGSIDETTRANSTSPDNSIVTFAIDPVVLVDGENIIAVEIHNRSTSSSDISFALQVEATIQDN